MFNFLWDHTKDINVSDHLRDYFSNPEKSYINLLILRKNLIKTISQQSTHISIDTEKIPIYKLNYQVDTNNNLVVNIETESKQTITHHMWHIKEWRGDELLQLLSGEKIWNAIIPQWQWSWIVGSICFLFWIESYDPYNKQNNPNGKVIKITPNFPFQKSDHSKANGMLRQSHTYNNPNHYYNILKELIENNSEEDILITWNETNSIESILELISLAEGKWHKFYILPNINIIKNAELLKVCYKKAYLLSLNSEEVTKQTNPLREDIQHAHQKLMNGTEKDYMRMVTHAHHGAFLAMQKDGNILHCRRDILADKDGQEIITTIIETCPKNKQALLQQYLHHNITGTVWCGDTSYSGLVVAEHNVENWALKSLLKWKDPQESLRIQAYYSLLFSQTLSYLTYHSKFSNFAQISEIMGDDAFQEVVAYIQEFVYDRTKEFISHDYVDKAFQEISINEQELSPVL